MSGVYKGENVNIPNSAKQGGGGGINVINGVFIGVVTDTTDSIYTGRIKVNVPEFGSKYAARWVLLITPFGGITQYKEAVKDPTLFGLNEEVTGGTPKSYGLWPQPPTDRDWETQVH